MLVMLAAGGVLIGIGGPAGWMLGTVYALMGVDLLWSEIQTVRWRRRQARRM